MYICIDGQKLNIFGQSLNHVHKLYIFLLIKFWHYKVGHQALPCAKCGFKTNNNNNNLFIINITRFILKS